MSKLDHEVLTKLSLSQAELARTIRTSRQAVNVGIRQEETYLNSNRLLRLHDAFHAAGDRRATMTAAMLKDMGIDVNAIMPGTISRAPDSHAEDLKEIWIFARCPLELEDAEYALQMSTHFRGPDKWILYFVPDEDTGERLAIRLTFALESVRRSGSPTAKVSIIVCKSVVFLPHCSFLNPRGDVKGCVKNVSGSFTEIDHGEAVAIVSMVLETGIRTLPDTLVDPYVRGVPTLRNGLSFRVLHENL